jgi:acetyltransferase-like isoleucine patch superfamily enzyme
MNPSNNDLLQWLELIKTSLPDLPFRNSEKSKNLRPEILRRISAGFLTDEERADYIGLPEGCRIREGAKIISQENLKIGKHNWIGENAILDASGGLKIGSHNSIGLSVYIWSHSSHLTNLMMDNKPGSDLIERKTTTIGNGVFIAGPSVILAGVNIGDKVVVRPLSTIEHDIPERSLVTPEGVREGFFTDERIQKMVDKNK